MLDIDPRDDDGFEAALRRVIEVAAQNGVSVEGGWKITSNHNGHSHWDLQITAVEYDDDAADEGVTVDAESDS